MRYPSSVQALVICSGKTFSPDLDIRNRFFLYRMQKAGIPCPAVVLLKKHILVMSFIGHDQVPAPKLKEVKLSSEEMTEAYYQTVHVCVPSRASHQLLKMFLLTLKRFPKIVLFCGDIISQAEVWEGMFTLKCVYTTVCELSQFGN